MSEQHLALGKMLRVRYGRVAEDPLPREWIELISAFYERANREIRARGQAREVAIDNAAYPDSAAIAT